MILPKCVWVVILKQANWFPARGVNRAFRELVDTVYVFEQKVYKSIAKYSTITVLSLYEKQHKADINDILYSACKTANWKIIDLTLSKGANNWNLGLTGACLYNQSEIMLLMIQKGATYCWYCGGTQHTFC